MEEKISGMEDFRVSADFARTLNVTLQEKMLEANEERATALFSKQKLEQAVQSLKVNEKQTTTTAKNRTTDTIDQSIVQEEIVQMEKAIKVLKKEHENRKRIRETARQKIGAVSKRVSALMIFQKKENYI
jgi:hypothetical protein